MYEINNVAPKDARAKSSGYQYLKQQYLRELFLELCQM